MTQVRVDYRCSNCGVPQSDIVVAPDATVTCSDCEQIADVGVYLGPDLHALLEERDPPVEEPL